MTGQTMIRYDKGGELNMNRLLCPSLMCADYGNLAQSVRELDEAGCDIFHCDIMDGSFVPNMTMGIMDLRAVRNYTEKPVDVHLMIENPAAKVDWFIDAGADIVYIHPEAERYVGKTLIHIRERGAKAGIAINPDTSISTVEEVLPYCDYVMVMTVNPGFAGQKFITSTRSKIKRLGVIGKKLGFQVIIDGACSPQVIKECGLLGADGFVLGTSALFGKNRPYKELIEELRRL